MVVHVRFHNSKYNIKIIINYAYIVPCLPRRQSNKIKEKRNKELRSDLE